MILHHYLSYSSPCSSKGPCHYHLGLVVCVFFFFGGGHRWFFIIIFFPMFLQRPLSLPFRVFFWGGRGPDGSSSLLVIFFPMILQRPMSLPFRVFFLGGRGPDGSSSLHVIFFPMVFQRSMSLAFRVGGGGVRGVPVVLHHYMSYSSPCSCKDPCHYHLDHLGKGV